MIGKFAAGAVAACLLMGPGTGWGRGLLNEAACVGHVAECQRVIALIEHATEAAGGDGILGLTRALEAVGNKCSAGNAEACSDAAVMLQLLR